MANLSEFDIALAPERFHTFLKSGVVMVSALAAAREAVSFPYRSPLRSASTRAFTSGGIFSSSGQPRV